ncbi:hypothetical protein J3458_021295 [Metarhizium acridum]|uniref:uncharacterized protein n=1 Tax=Metarhizium acridum TaxID=92637 RepID=UPI001C6C2117|nr:hypothetical protein J3458_021295 [Metarhizium acridum]
MAYPPLSSIASSLENNVLLVSQLLFCKGLTHIELVSTQPHHGLPNTDSGRLVLCMAGIPSHVIDAVRFHLLDTRELTCTQTNAPCLDPLRFCERHCGVSHVLQGFPPGLDCTDKEPSDRIGYTTRVCSLQVAVVKCRHRIESRSRWMERL